MIPIKVESAWQGTVDCQKCGIRDMVLFADLNQEDFAAMHTPIDDLRFPPRSTLYVEAQHAEFVMTIRSGMVKLVRNIADGRERIVRILREGDVVGLEAIATGQYGHEAVALTELSVCRIPIQLIQQLSTTSPRLHKRLTTQWQSALQSADDWITDLNFGSARRRVAQLILKMRDPLQPQMATVFSREDMGGMLDLKLETVSREISRFIHDGLIRPADRSNRRYEILNIDQLSQVD